MSVSNRKLKLQELGGRLVEREVYYCVSSLIYELAQDGKYMDDLMPILVNTDWVEPAKNYINDMDREALLESLGEFDIQCFQDEDIEALRKALLINLKKDGWLQEFCENHRIDPYENKVHEHWIVSDWLAAKLEDEGESVLHDFLGLTLWGRVCTGQAVEFDYIIQKIAAEFWPAEMRQ